MSPSLSFPEEITCEFKGGEGDSNFWCMEGPGISRKSSEIPRLQLKCLHWPAGCPADRSHWLKLEPWLAFPSAADGERGQHLVGKEKCPGIGWWKRSWNS